MLRIGGILEEEWCYVTQNWWDIRGISLKHSQNWWDIRGFERRNELRIGGILEVNSIHVAQNWWDIRGPGSRNDSELVGY